jgi:response regulator NasT
MSRRATVLTVEDDPIVRADLRLILTEAGFDVVPDARDGVEAVELAREHRPDVVLLDLGLPKLDGIEAARQIRSERSVPIVALTGRRETGASERAMAAGASSVMTKPFVEGELVSTLRAVLDLVPSRPEYVEESREWRRRALIDGMVRSNSSEREIGRALRGL